MTHAPWGRSRRHVALAATWVGLLGLLARVGGAQEPAVVPLRGGSFALAPGGFLPFAACRAALSGPWLALSDSSGDVALVEETWNGWVRQQELTFRSRVTSLALDGDLLAVGLAHAGMQGEVQLWRLAQGSWSHEATLGPRRPALQGAQFGAAVAVSSGLLVVGAPGDDEVASAAGALEVHALTPAGSVLRHRLVDPQGVAGAGLGAQLALRGDLLVASGLEGESCLSFYARAERFGRDVLVYRRLQGAFTYDGRLAALAGARDGFGAALATDGDAIAVGAPDDARVDWSRGRVDVFERGAAGWALVATRRWIPAHVLGQGPGFGAALAMAPGVLVVTDRDQLTWQWQFGGGLSIFAREPGPSSPTSALWARRIAWSAFQSCVLAGALLASEDTRLAVVSTDRSCVEFVDLAPALGRTLCQGEQGFVPGNVAPQGPEREVRRFELHAAGEADAATGRARLVGVSPGATHVQLLLGRGAATTLNPGGIRGLLCVGGPLARRLLSPEELGSVGAYELEVVWSEVPVALAPAPGETWVAQLYGRRSAWGVLSGAVAVTLR